MPINCTYEKEVFTLNEYFTYRLNENQVLITTRHGGWCVLSQEEYLLLKNNLVDDKFASLFEKLKEAGVILTKNNINGIVADLRKENSFLLRPATYHVIDVTDKCNFNCIYCHPDATFQKKDMDEKTADKVLDFIFSIPSSRQEIIIEGGEPLLNWNLVKYLYNKSKEKVKQNGIKSFRFGVTTNLSLMTDNIAKEMAEMKIHPAVSFDGPKELHNRHRPFANGNGSYDIIIYWFHRLREKYNLRASFLPLITKISLGYGPKAFIDEFLKHDNELVFFKPFRPSGRALKNLEELKMSPEEFFDFLKSGIEYCISLNKKGIKVRERLTSNMVENIISPHRSSMCHRRPCGAGGFPMLSYGIDGSIYACDSLRSIDFFTLGNVATDTYQTIRERALPLIALAPDLIPICSSCPFMAYCGLCLADTAGQDNDIYPKIPRSFSCKWQKMAFEYLFTKLSKEDEDAKILKSWVPNYNQQKPLCRP